MTALAATTATSSVVVLTGAAPTSMALSSSGRSSCLSCQSCAATTTHHGRSSSLGGLLGLSFAYLLSLVSPLGIRLALEVSSQRLLALPLGLSLLSSTLLSSLGNSRLALWRGGVGGSCGESECVCGGERMLRGKG